MKRSMGGLLLNGLPPGATPAPGRRRLAGWSRGTVALVLAGLVVGACSSSTATAAGTGTPAPTSVAPAATSTPAATDTPAPSSEPSLATGVPTSLDPCQLVTSQEASQLAGASYGAGVEGTTSGGGKTCVYGGQTLNVFTVIVGQAPDVATAQAGKAEAQAAILQQAGKGIAFTELPNFADGAAYLVGSFTVSGQTLNGSAIYVLKGTVFFGFSDLALGHPTPTSAALQAQAQVILGRLP
jgi:hypothetical protein